MFSNRRVLSHAIASFILVSGAVPSAKAVMLDWSAFGSGQPSGGTGSWDLSSLLWVPDTGSTYQTWNNSDASSVARFAGNPGTVTINDNVSTTGLQFDSDGYVLNNAPGKSLTIFSSFTPTVTVTNAGQTATINAPIAGTSGFQFGGDGTLVLAGVNTFTGSMVISSGTLQLSASTGSLNSNNNIYLGSSAGGGSGTFIYDNTGASGATSQTLGLLSVVGGDGTVESNRVAAQNVSLIFANGQHYNPGAAVNYVVNGGTNGTQNKIVLTGQTTGFINIGSFFGGSNYAWYDATGFVRGINYGVDAGSITRGATTSITGTNYVRITGTISAQATATFKTLNIAGANDFTLASGATVTVSGILKSGGGSATISGGTAIQTTGNADLEFRTDLASDSLTISTVIAKAGTNTVTKSGAGTLTLSGANAYTGKTYIDGGTLSIPSIANSGTASPLGTNASIQINGGTLQYTGATASTDRGFTIGYGGGGIEVTQAGTTLTFTGTAIGANTGLVGDSLIKSGSGTLVLGGSGDDSGLAVIVNDGMLQLAKSKSSAHAVGGALGLIVNSGGTAQLAGSASDQIYDSAAVVINTGGLFDLNGKNEAFDGLSGGGTVTNSTNTTSTVTIGANNNSTGSSYNGFSGSINGKVNVIKTGTGIETFSGASTYTGTTTVSGGTLLVNNLSGSATGTGNVTVNSGATFGGHGFEGGLVDIKGGATLSPSASNNGPGALTFNSGLTLEANSTLSLQLGATSDEILVTSGTFNTTGPITLNLTVGSGYDPGQVYTLFSWTGATAPNFSASNFTLNFPAASPFSQLQLSGNSLRLVPEPTENWLIAAGALGAGILRWRRRIKHAPVTR